MSEQQQYRVIADRDKGDDPRMSDVQVEDRATWVVGMLTGDNPPLVRIERPVSATASIELLAAGEFQDPHPPTREQIAALERMRGDLAYGQEFSDRYIRVLISDLDAVLALIQDGADRG